MKKELHPAVVAAALIVAICVIGLLVWRGTNGDAANVPPGGVGNPGPFAPGGSQVGKSGRPTPAGGGNGAPSGNPVPGAVPAATEGSKGR